MNGWPDLRASILRERVFDRIARSAQAQRAFVTQRWRGAPVEQPAPGVTWRRLYDAGAAGPRRPGEPQRVQLIELAPGARWGGWPADGQRREWLPMRGSVVLGGQPLSACDYQLVPAGQACGELRSDGGALVYLREAPAAAGAAAVTQRDADGGWHDFAPGIRRRLLWQQGGEAAMLYRALPGASVPRHGHRHDEECLMLDGELFVDDLLLQRGDYQMAPAGSHHGGVLADSEVLLFAHGDLDLDVTP